MFTYVGVFIKLFIIFNSVSSKSAAEVEENLVAECGLYLVPLSNPEYGRGLVAGKFIANEQQIDKSVTLAVRSEDIKSTQLNNYVFGTSEEGIAIAELGLDMIYNHRDHSTLKRTWASGDLFKFEDQKLAHTTYNQVAISVPKNVSVGEELFTDYGGSHWFESRNIPLDLDLANELRSIDDLKMNGICMTDTGVKNSKLPFAGKGLFAKRSFSKGDIVTLSPVLLLGKDRVMDSAKTPSVLMNYCIASAYSNITLFPIALAALINHSPASTANVQVDWYWWNKDGTNEETMNRKMQTSLLDLSLKEAAQLDLQYIATRDIEAGEEILYSYGEEWQDAWSEYSAEISEWSEKVFKQTEVRELRVAAAATASSTAIESVEVTSDGEGGVDLNAFSHEGLELLSPSADMPRFRYFIDGLDHLFLPSWRDTNQNDQNLS